MAVCYNCGAPFPQEKVFRSSLCPSCGKELKVCLNCAFYSPGSHWDCHETIPEPVAEKDRANFCGYFRPSSKSATPAEGTDKKDDARDSFDNLFDD